MAINFLYLPAEIRNEIYVCALQDRRGLQVMSIWVKHQYALKSDFSSSAPALLGTCRTVNREATAILYGENKIMVGAASVPGFISQIGVNIRHLRFLEIGFHGSSMALRSAMRAMKNVSELEVLTIGILSLGDSRDSWTMARALSPWVKAQYGRQQQQQEQSSGDPSEKKDIVDVVKVLEFSARHDGYGWANVGADYGEEVKGNLIRMMG